MRTAGLMITMIGVMMADTEALWIPLTVVAAGLLLIKIGGLKDVER